MTIEEAISFLQGRVDLIDKHYPDIKDYREALVMAIKVLEQEPVLDKIRPICLKKCYPIVEQAKK